MMFSLTPIVVQSLTPSLDSISTRVRAAVPHRRIDDANLVVGEPNASADADRTDQRRAQRPVERIHRTVAVGDRVGVLAADAQLDGRLADRRPRAVRAHRDVVGVDVKRRAAPLSTCAG